MNKKFGAVANRILENSVAICLHDGDMILRDAWEHLTSDILAHRFEAWSDHTQNEIVDKFSESVLSLSRLQTEHADELNAIIPGLCGRENVW